MRSLLLLCFCLAAAPCAVVADGRSDAFAARAILGPKVWSRVVRIENSRAQGLFRMSKYPGTVYAVVFKLSDVLWFYTDTDGTQSLSLMRGTVNRDVENPGLLFLAIDPGFTQWSWVDDPPVAGTIPVVVPKGCFVESIGAFVRRLASGGEASAPTLLSYYVDTPRGRLGHTVLLFSAGGRLNIIDPERSDRPIEIPEEVGGDAAMLSAFLRGGPVSAVRTFSVEGLAPPANDRRWALMPGRGPASG